MKKLAFLSLLLPSLLVACGDDEDQVTVETVETVEGPPAWEASIDSETPLGELSADEIAQVCGSLTLYLSQFERELACTTRALGETGSTDTCEASVTSCDVDSSDLDEYVLPSAPTEINCEVFTTDAVAGCELPLTALETCVAGLRSGVEKTRDDLSCSSASEIDSDATVENTRLTKNSCVGDAATACVPLAEPCMGLLEAILSP